MFKSQVQIDRRKCFGITCWDWLNAIWSPVYSPQHIYDCNIMSAFWEEINMMWIKKNHRTLLNTYSKLPGNFCAVFSFYLCLLSVVLLYKWLYELTTAGFIKRRIVFSLKKKLFSWDKMIFYKSIKIERIIHL